MKQAKYLNILILFLFFLILLVSFFYNYHYTFYLIIPSFLILLVCSIPILISDKHNIFSPLNFLIYFIFLNILIRNIYIIYDYPSKNYVDSVFLLFQDKDILIKPILITLVSFLFFIIGYLISFKPKFNSKKIQVWNLGKLNILSFIPAAK